MIQNKHTFFQLYKILPSAIDEYLRTIQPSKELALHSALSEIGAEVKKSNRTIIDQVTFDNYPYYLGFKGL
jgi:isocitrate dehydrogenase kinase/phosphatase